MVAGDALRTHAISIDVDASRASSRSPCTSDCSAITSTTTPRPPSPRCTASRASDPDLAVPPEAIQRGLADVDWPGRLQVLQRAPLLVLDGAHNAFSAEVLGRAIEQNFTFDHLLLVLGLSQGKDAHGVLDALGWRANAALRDPLAPRAFGRSERPGGARPRTRAPTCA